MAYIDGFVIPVLKSKKADYVKSAKIAAAVFKECGALGVTECWGDDVPPGKLTSFPLAVKCTDEEQVVFSWVTRPSRAARDAGNAKFMADPRVQPGVLEIPVDGKRMIFGGFEVMLEG